MHEHVHVDRMQGFLGLGDVVWPTHFGEKLAAKFLKGNRIYKGNFHFWGKLHDFKEIFLGEVTF